MRYHQFIASLLLAVLFLSPSAFAEERAREYLVKAAFIYNFTKYVSWPAERAPETLKRVQICVLGENPFTGKAASVFTEGSTPQKVISLHEIASAEQAAGQCHIVFISGSETPNMARHLAVLKTAPVLTISDTPDFIGKGGIIGFVLQDNKVKIVINNKVANQAGLRLNAQLLEIAVSVVN